MDEPFGQFVATLHKAQGTMAVQLDRHGLARVPDRVRLPLLQREAGLFGSMASALLARATHAEASLELIEQIRVLATFFEDVERRTASLLRQGDRAGPNAAREQDDEALNEASSQEDGNELGGAVGARSRPGRPAPDANGRRNSVAPTDAVLGSSSRPAKARVYRRV